MSTLKDILYRVSLISTKGDMNVDVREIHFDSRQISQGDLFIAVKGTQTDGHQFIDSAIKKGAAAIVCEILPGQLPENIVFVQVKNSAEALGFIASNFFDNPSERLKVVAVTGTNGKTTTVTLLHQVFMELGYQSGLLSTIHNKINDEIIPATHTTPDSIQLNRLLSQMVKKGCTHCFMEASSHAIEQHRIAGLQIDVAVFTNITHDHLDYHKTFEGYIKSKKKLFDDLSNKSSALVNVDDKRGRVMIQNTKAAVFSYGIRNMADFKAKILTNSMEGLELDLNGILAWFPLVGMFNAYNILAVIGVGTILHEEPTALLTALSSAKRVQGRFELIKPESGIFAIVDYAHTPNALENVLSAINELRTGAETVITVVGCGGNRDREKRPLMADIACRFSNKVIFTSDNPRDEDPEMIISEMQRGVKPQDHKKTMAITNRKEAIKVACSMASKKDIILVAGKGHETYQEIKGIKYDFDDRKVLSEMLDLMVN
ncbi:MAG: UDP-N-acetylmuramoyl-L-alanyl-D-glutamate--2,6-diaminopimelate ligase [Cyclobacteriaceae bacterium]|nr:UDP-N-acetylmuramoyl-L-alanyl-D-glutamate--2,6-diaminopimelate ligase [Cyclobacteriaceae bacterium]